MAVSEEDIREEEIVQEDFKKAKEIYDRILKETDMLSTPLPEILFTLCLIYVRQLKHHKYEEMEGA